MNDSVSEVSPLKTPRQQGLLWNSLNKLERVFSCFDFFLCPQNSSEIYPVNSTELHLVFDWNSSRGAPPTSLYLYPGSSKKGFPYFARGLAWTDFGMAHVASQNSHECTALQYFFFPFFFASSLNLGWILDVEMLHVGRICGKSWRDAQQSVCWWCTARYVGFFFFLFHLRFSKNSVIQNPQDE